MSGIIPEQISWWRARGYTAAMALEALTGKPAQRNTSWLQVKQRMRRFYSLLIEGERPAE